MKIKQLDWKRIGDSQDDSYESGVYTVCSEEGDWKAYCQDVIGVPESFRLRYSSPEDAKEACQAHMENRVKQMVEAYTEGCEIELPEPIRKPIEYLTQDPEGLKECKEIIYGINEYSVVYVQSIEKVTRESGVIVFVIKTEMSSCNSIDPVGEFEFVQIDCSGRRVMVLCWYLDRLIDIYVDIPENHSFRVNSRGQVHILAENKK